MRNLLVILSFMMMVGCGEEEEILENIKTKMEQGKVLSKKQQCIADTLVSSIVDPKNIMLYYAAFDVLSRAYISQNAQIINYCHPMIVSSRQSNAFDDYTENCPEVFKELSNDQLKELDIRAQELANMAADFEGSPIDATLGSCDNF